MKRKPIIIDDVEFIITKWTKHITDEGIDKVVAQKPKHLPYKFRLLDDDKVIYGYGYCSAEEFEPLDYYEGSYGCCEIQYKNQKTGLWETL